MKMGLLGNVVDGGQGGEGEPVPEHCKEEASHRVACCSRGRSSLSLNSCLSLAWVPDFCPSFPSLLGLPKASVFESRS